MRCTATNSETDHVVEWRTEDPELTLRWGEHTVSNQIGRFIFDTSIDMATQTVVQNFTITNVQRADTNEYVCNVNDPILDGGNDIVASSNVTLSVLYFPSESFPMCSPAGPITVDAGTELDMRCSSESSHGTVIMTIIATVQTTRYPTWTSSVINVDNDTVVRTLNLTVDDADNGVAFDCFISSMYFAKGNRTCQIGPITVRNTVTHDRPTTSPTTTSFSASTQSTSTTSASPVVIVGAVAGAVVAFLLIVVLIFSCRKRRSGNSTPKSGQSNSDINPTNTELALDRLEHSYISINEHGEIDSIQHGLQDNIIYVPFQSPVSGLGASCAGTLPVQTTEATDLSLLYGKPNPYSNSKD